MAVRMPPAAARRSQYSCQAMISVMDRKTVVSSPFLTDFGPIAAWNSFADFGAEVPSHAGVVQGVAGIGVAR